MKMMAATKQERERAAEGIHEAVTAGYVKPPVAQTFPLKEAAEAHKAVMESPHRGKIILTIP